MAGMPDNEDLRLMLDYWAGKRRGRPLPGRADIDPVELPGRLWPLISLFDVVRDGERLRFRYRRIGTSFVKAFGRDPTGRFIDDVLATRGRHRDYVVGLYGDLVATRKPIYSESTVWLDGEPRPHRRTQRLCLPLASDGERVDMILAVHVFDYASRRDALVPSTAAGAEIMGGMRVVLEP